MKQRSQAPAKSMAAAWSGLQAVMAGYSQVLFSPSPIVGLLVLGATLVHPVAGLYGLLGTVLAYLAGRLGRLPADPLESGVFGFNSMLMGLGIGALFVPTPQTALLAAACVLLTLWLNGRLYHYMDTLLKIPSLTLPLVVALIPVALLSPLLPGIQPTPPLTDSGLFFPSLPQPLAWGLRSLGALFFLPRCDTGLLILTAIFLHSRLAGLLASAGLTVAWLLVLALAPEMPEASTWTLGFNLALVPLALASVYFLPRPKTLAVALLATLGSGLLALALTSPFERLGLFLGTTPFLATTIPIMAYVAWGEKRDAPRSPLPRRT